jgi:hypothetical protein
MYGCETWSLTVREKDMLKFLGGHLGLRSTNKKGEMKCMQRADSLLKQRTLCCYRTEIKEVSVSRICSFVCGTNERCTECYGRQRKRLWADGTGSWLSYCFYTYSWLVIFTRVVRMIKLRNRNVQFVSYPPYIIIFSFDMIVINSETYEVSKNKLVLS